MAISDIYTARSGSVAVAQTTALALLSVISTATLRAWVVGVRVEIGVTAAVAGNSLLFQLARPALTTVNATTTQVSSHDYAAPVAVAVQAVAWTVTPTVGTILWEQELPQTTGSAWEEFPPLGYEWQVPAVANNSSAAGIGLHMFVTASVNTSTPVYADIVFSE